MARWWFVTWSTYGWWLPGDPRGFQTRRGREYVPPPARYAKPGEPTYKAKDYAYRWRRAKKLCPNPVILTPEEQHLAFDAVIAAIDELPLVPRILAHGRCHAHLISQFGKLLIRPTVGRLKSKATQRIPNPGTRPRIWVVGCHMKSLNGEAAFNDAVQYVRDHESEGALIYEWPNGY